MPAAYDYAEGLLVRETFKNGLNFYFEYEGTGPEARCVHTWGDEGIYDHRLVYDLEAKRTMVTNSLGHATTYQGNENGLVVETWDARGGVTLTEYNEHNELLRETNALGQTTSYDYDERGNCTQVQTADSATTKRVFDEADRLLQLTDVMGRQWQWAYDQVGNVTHRGSPVGQVTYTYAKGLLQQLTVAARRTTTFVHDDSGNLLERQTADGQKSQWLYDLWGRVRKASDERGNVQWYEYDLLSRIKVMHEPDGNVRRFTYDALDNVTRTQDRHTDVQYAYRGLGRMIRRAEKGTAIELLHDTEQQLRAVVNEHGLTYRFELDGEGEVATEFGFDGLTRHYTRDAGGRIIALRLPTGQYTRYDYDSANRVTEVHYSDGTGETYMYRSDGALLAAINDTREVYFERDALGNVLQESQGQHTVLSEYNKRGRRTKLTSSLGAELYYTRDEQGGVSQLKAGSWQALFERDAQGLEVQRALSGGVRTRSVRDQLGRLSEQRISVGTGNKQVERTRRYTWQTGDQLSQVNDSQHGLTRFEHDALGSLAGTTFGDGTQELRMPDAVGNLFTSADRRDRRYGPAGQLLATRTARYEYDALGNLSKKTTVQGQEWHYNWNAAGRLGQVVRPDGVVVLFTYDALGGVLS